MLCWFLLIEGISWSCSPKAVPFSLYNWFQQGLAYVEEKVFGSKMGYYLGSFPGSCGITLQADFSLYIQLIKPSPRNGLGQTVKEILVFDLAIGK